MNCCRENRIRPGPSGTPSQVAQATIVPDYDGRQREVDGECWILASDHYLSPTAIEIKSYDILAIRRRDWLAELFVEGVQLIRKHLVLLAYRVSACSRMLACS
jgi:hypothetical protein